MKTLITTLSLILCPAGLAQLAAPIPAPQPSGDLLPPQQNGPVATEQQQPVLQPATEEVELSPGESRIRAGIVLLGMLHDTLAKVQDHDTAEHAVMSIMKLSRELQSWGQGFNALPPLAEATQSEYEKRYLPIINKINERIQLQAERIAAAEFYGSENLPAALVRLVNSVQ